MLILHQWLPVLLPSFQCLDLPQFWSWHAARIIPFLLLSFSWKWLAWDFLCPSHKIVHFFFPLFRNKSCMRPQLQVCQLKTRAQFLKKGPFFSDDGHTDLPWWKRKGGARGSERWRWTYRLNLFVETFSGSGRANTRELSLKGNSQMRFGSSKPCAKKKTLYLKKVTLIPNSAASILSFWPFFFPIHYGRRAKAPFWR